LLAKTIPEAETILSIAYAADRALLVEPTAMVVEVSLFDCKKETETRFESMDVFLRSRSTLLQGFLCACAVPRHKRQDEETQSRDAKNEPRETGKGDRE